MARKRHRRRRSHSRRPRIVYVNPRKRRHRHRRHHRRNPSVGGALKGILAALIPAAAGGFGAGLIDTKVTANMPTVARVGAKLAVAALGGALLRKNPVRAAAFMGAMVGTAAYEPGIRMGGGVVAVGRPQGMKELAAMAAEDEQSLGLLQTELQGMGLLEDGTAGMGDEPDLGDIGNEPDLGDEAEVADLGDDD